VKDLEEDTAQTKSKSLLKKLGRLKTRRYSILAKNRVDKAHVNKLEIKNGLTLQEKIEEQQFIITNDFNIKYKHFQVLF